MRTDGRSFCLVVAIILVTIAGCKPRRNAGRQSGQTSEPSAAEVTTIRDALTHGMQQTAFDSLAAADVGRQCVVTARVSEGTGTDQAPPPLGMVRRLGQTVIYKGEIQEVSPDALKILRRLPDLGPVQDHRDPALATSSPSTWPDRLQDNAANGPRMLSFRSSPAA